VLPSHLRAVGGSKLEEVYRPIGGAPSNALCWFLGGKSPSSCSCTSESYTNDQHMHGTHTERYSKSAARAQENTCPIVAILLPAARNRFADLLKSVNDVRHLTAHDVVSCGLDDFRGEYRFSSDVTVVHLRLFHMSRGLRPERVPDRAHRVRVGRDSNISDLVCALNQQDQHDCICFDLGGKVHPVRLVSSEYDRKERKCC